MINYEIFVGDNLHILQNLKEQSVQCVVTSPPYWGLRDYGHEGQLGHESKPEDYIANLCNVFDEVWRVLANDGTLWLNLGDSYASKFKGSGGRGKSTLGPNKDLNNIEFQKMAVKQFEHGVKDKDLMGIPWRVAFALRDRGWYLRSDIIWAKPNPMPESITDRPTKSHEHIFLLTKSPKYYYDHQAICEPAESASYSFRNKRDVWTVANKPFKEAHFATYPPALIEPCILAGSKEGDIVLDPFNGSGTTGLVALAHKRNYIGIEINSKYAEMTHARIAKIGKDD